MNTFTICQKALYTRTTTRLILHYYTTDLCVVDVLSRHPLLRQGLLDAALSL